MCSLIPDAVFAVKPKGENTCNVCLRVAKAKTEDKCTCDVCLMLVAEAIGLVAVQAETEGGNTCKVCLMLVVEAVACPLPK